MKTSEASSLGHALTGSLSAMPSGQCPRTAALAALPAPPGQRRTALVVSLLLLLMLLVTAPFARAQWPNFPAFVPIQKTLTMVADLITAALLFGQYSIERSPGLNVLAAGYLFTALITIPHMLTFPGVFSESGILGAGPQSAAWLYIAWHGGLPLATIAFARRRRGEMAEGEPMDSVASIWAAIIAATGAVAAVTLLIIVGHDWLPSLIEGGRFTNATRVAVGILLLLPLSALLMLARRRSALDLWLMVVMFAWFCTTSVGAFLSSGRYDVGWYIGLLFDSLTSLFVLLILLHQVIALYARQFRAAAIERRERERRMNQAEAILIHLSRVSEIGQSVSSLIHEVNQPLSAISNYVAAGLQLIRAAKFDRLEPILERTQEQSFRAIEIIRHLKDFIARRETKKSVGDVQDMLNNAVQLAMIGVHEETSIVQIQCAPAASSAFFNRVQIEQVVFNLVRNAIEAMTDTPQRMLTIATILNSDDMVEVSVADTGPGLSAEIRDRLFEPFVSSKTGGLGIGLSICSMIVEAHGGRLIADENPGGGTVFRFTLPHTATLAGRSRDAMGL